MDNKFDSLLELVEDYINKGHNLAMESSNWLDALETFRDEAIERLNTIEHDLDMPDGSLSDCAAMHDLICTIDTFNECDDDHVPGEDMDGDAESALASCGHGNDEDYGGGDEHY